ncbi:hypothetical protein [Cohnella zeiphila]|uniref:Guanylate cyclase domain-containing protein n=1 Tax=Cohnella zeiphila TaxID=2761120 RepID=A0A7X0SMT3_9BACL|nr:hypothetical protein [Cohnella zeiphila]MBB6732811.1 hypothetical protein [Cohnella zeiphila]
MTLAQNVVCYLDILGFKNMVLSDRGQDEPRFLPIIEEVYKIIKDRLMKSGLEIKQFSDSIVLATSYYSIANTIKLLRAVCDVQYHMVVRGVLVRGGVSLGKHFSSGDILYSEGLVNAYVLESSQAKFPRVLVHDGLLDILLSSPMGNNGEVIREFCELFLVDKDSLTFLNYILDKDICIHEDAIKKLIKTTNLSEPGLYDKYRWLSEYHNYLVCTKGMDPIDFELPQFQVWRKEIYESISKKRPKNINI